jgi:site-specific DNA-cytosine methylase
MSNDCFITVVKSKQTHAFDCATDINGVCPTLTAAMGMGGGMIPMLTNATINECKTDRFMEQTRKSSRLNLPDELKGKKFRIRKLTPRECFRLMGVDEADIDIIQAYPYESIVEHPAYSKDERFRGMTEQEKRKAMKNSISESAQYKLAGNSIVVDVLYHIFRKMFVETENESKQLTLF